MAGYNGYVNNSIGNGYNGYVNNGVAQNTVNNGPYGNSMNNGAMYGLTPQQIVQYYQQGYLEWTDFVHGRAGAEAYQLPPGVIKAKLWDDETDRFYMKSYDDNGRPRIMGDNDFQTHIDPEPSVSPQIDLTPYATKDDIKSMISEALSTLQIPNMSGYVTVDQFNQTLGNLSVGNGGRIVRNESNV